ncbi:unnamed protein product [Bursaphelenchus okinawaensis]|uniref:G_PROTEIN_RECEP_F1_2 domain-containing protein n=1 Tax=Bursaphelenchus okinawaensis TaxID=465554 RepID=A0A811KTJ8_9BILA|nr:unnamed protein product [Bursaphelenchus okinawaensis]CAG9112140.1 unnamed protein product [Bursaphelenchus okinawaensis]
MPTVETEFNVSDIQKTLFMCSLYVTLGTVAVTANLLNMMMFLTHRELRTNHIFLIALDFGEMINGLSYVLTGIGRGTHALQGDYGQPISVHECFFHKYWPVFLIMGTEIPALMTMLQSFERVVAVEKASLYNKIFIADFKPYWIMVVFGTEMVFILTAALSSWHNARINSDKHCAIISSTAGFYSTFHFLFIVMAYMVSFVSLYTIYHFSQKRKKEQEKTVMSSNNNKADKQLKVFMIMTAMDIVLVFIPGFVMLGAKWQFFAPNDITVSLTYSTTGFISLVHIFINYYFNEQFRRQVRWWRNKVMGKSPPEPSRMNVTVMAVTVTPKRTVTHFNNKTI